MTFAPRRPVTLLLFAWIFAAWTTACARTAPYREDAVRVESDASGRSMVRLQPVLLKTMHDGEVTLALLAARESRTRVAELTIERDAEMRHHQECRTVEFTTSGGSVASVTGGEVAYHSDYIDGDFVESITVHVDRETLAAIAADPKSAIAVCSARFALHETVRRYVGDFVERWNAEPGQEPGE